MKLQHNPKLVQMMRKEVPITFLDAQPISQKILIDYNSKRIHKRH